MQPAASVVPFDFAHVRFDQEDATPAAFMKIFLGGRVGNPPSFKPRPFVLDENFRPVRIDAGLDEDLFTRVHPVAMLDGIHQGFLQRNAQGKEIFAAKPVLLGGNQDLLLNVVAVGKARCKREGQVVGVGFNGAAINGAIDGAINRTVDRSINRAVTR